MNKRISRRRFLKLSSKFLALSAALIALPGGIIDRYIVGTKRFSIPIKEFKKDHLYKSHNYAG